MPWPDDPDLRPDPPLTPGERLLVIVQRAAMVVLAVVLVAVLVWGLLQPD